MDETAQGLLVWVDDQADRMGTDYEEVLQEAQRRIEVLTATELSITDRSKLSNAIAKLEGNAVRSGVDDQDWFDKVAGLLPAAAAAIEVTDADVALGEETLEKFDVDGDGEFSPQESATATAIEIETGGGTSELDKIKELTGDFVAPQWLVDLTGRDYSEEELEEILTVFNEELVKNGLPPVDSLEDANAESQNLALDLAARYIGPVEEEVVFEPFTHLEMKFGPDFTMKTVDFEEAKALTGFDDDAFQKTLEVADAFGMRREGGNELAWQPVSLLMNMTGHMVSTSREDRQAILGRIRTLGQQIKGMEEGKGPVNPEVANSRLQAARRQYQKLIAEWRSMSPTVQADGAVGNSNLREVFDRFGAGIEMYGNIESLAMLHAVNPGLAARLWESNGDVQKVSATDKNLAGYYLSKAVPGAGSSGDAMGAALVSMGYGEAGGDAFVIDVVGNVDVVRNPEKYAPDDGSGRTRIVPDRMAVEQNARDTMEILYPTAANDEDVRAITERVMNDAATAPDDQDINLESRIRQYVEELPQYGEFYGNKPGGVTEGQYKNVMTAGSRSMLGNEGDLTQAGALGMKSGKYQTAVGAAIGTSAAYDNSTFMGRLAQAAQITSRNT